MEFSDKPAQWYTEAWSSENDRLKDEVSSPYTLTYPRLAYFARAVDGIDSNTGMR